MVTNQLDAPSIQESISLAIQPNSQDALVAFFVGIEIILMDSLKAKNERIFDLYCITREKLMESK